MRFTPHVTVATIVEDNGRFLMVEELAEGRAVFNQPAGHLEADESLIQAALRETLEETAWEVELTGVVGIYLYTAPSNGVTYQRICFAAHPLKHHPERALDSDIVRAVWLTRDELLAFIRESTTPVGKREIARAYGLKGDQRIEREDPRRALERMHRTKQRIDRVLVVGAGFQVQQAVFGFLEQVAGFFKKPL